MPEIKSRAAAILAALVIATAGCGPQGRGSAPEKAQSTPGMTAAAPPPAAPTARAAGGAGGENALIATDSRFHPVIGANGMVAAQERIAAAVGRDILARGGNAVDAAVATGFALAVTHPQAGNIGGGGFMLIALKDRADVVALDFREMAPAAASRDMFLGPDGEVDNRLARFSHLSAGVPGSVMGLTKALDAYGTMPLADVMAPAIALAEEGFEVSFAFHDAVARAKERFRADPSSVAYFLTAGGEAPPVGSVFRQTDLAQTLKAIAAKGAAGFYEGRVADLLVDEMEANGGLITHDDLRRYRAVERKAVSGTFRGHEVVSMPPPSSGGVHVIEMLNILEGDDLKSLGHNSAAYIHILVEAMRRAYADRSEYLGDPDFYDVPIDRLTDKNYARALRAGFDPEKAGRSDEIKPGLGPARESEETTHYSVMDKDGNAVSVTTTLNFFFGGGFTVDGAGFFLNNEMDDFSAKKGAPNGFGLLGGEANAIEPGKRPLSSMTPTIVRKDGVPVLITGSPGGSTIITIVLQMILNVVEFDMNAMEASAVPRIHHQWMPDAVIVEPGVSVDTLRILDERGFSIAKTPDGAYSYRVMGRTATIVQRDGILYGAADPRAADGGVSAH